MGVVSKNTMGTRRMFLSSLECRIPDALTEALARSRVPRNTKRPVIKRRQSIKHRASTSHSESQVAQKHEKENWRTIQPFHLHNTEDSLPTIPLCNHVNTLTSRTLNPCVTPIHNWKQVSSLHITETYGQLTVLFHKCTDILVRQSGLSKRPTNPSTSETSAEVRLT